MCFFYCRMDPICATCNNVRNCPVLNASCTFCYITVPVLPKCNILNHVYFLNVKILYPICATCNVSNCPVLNDSCAFCFIVQYCLNLLPEPYN
jgi:hypothetical protein